jgi:hypothetical protein
VRNVKRADVKSFFFGISFHILPVPQQLIFTFEIFLFGSMDPLLNADGYKQRDANSDLDRAEYPGVEDVNLSEYNAQDYSYAGEELEPAYEKPEKPDFTSVDGWVVESGRIALPREITVRLEKMKWNAKFQV